MHRRPRRRPSVRNANTMLRGPVSPRHHRPLGRGHALVCHLGREDGHWGPGGLREPSLCPPELGAPLKRQRVTDAIQAATDRIVVLAATCARRARRQWLGQSEKRDGPRLMQGPRTMMRGKERKSKVTRRGQTRQPNGLGTCRPSCPVPSDPSPPRLALVLRSRIRAGYNVHLHYSYRNSGGQVPCSLESDLMCVASSSSE